MSRQRIRQALFDRLDREPAAAAPSPEAPAPSRPARRWVAYAAAAAAACIAIGVGLARFWPGQVGHDTVSRVVTGDAPTTLALKGGELVVAAHTSLTVTEQANGGVRVVLERGGVDCSVAPREGRPPFVVWAAEIQVEVVGTRFLVTREDERVEVSVTKGRVRVTRADETVVLAPGERWSSVEAPPAAAVAPPAPEAETEVEMDPVVMPGVAARAKAKYRKAQRVEVADPQEALKLYRELSQDGGPWADTALYGEGFLQLRLGHRAEARRVLKEALARYPKHNAASLAKRYFPDLE